MIQFIHNGIAKFIIVGDRMLYKPRELESRTETGLYLPPGVVKKEQIQNGYVVKADPGYPTMAGL